MSVWEAEDSSVCICLCVREDFRCVCVHGMRAVGVCVSGGVCSCPGVEGEVCYALMLLRIFQW